MCRSIKTLHNFTPPATSEEIRASSLQFVRKLSGFAKPSRANDAAFARAVDQVTRAAHELLASLVTSAPPRLRDVEAAKAVNRRTLANYAFLPNYRNYWKEAGYVEEMEAIEKAIADGRRDDVAKHLSDKWLADNTLFGPAAKVREGVAAWRAAGVHTPILVPSSAAGNQMKAIEEVFTTFG